MKSANPYTGSRYCRLWRRGRASGLDYRRSRAVCPGVSASDRAAWLKGFESGRASVIGAGMGGK